MVIYKRKKGTQKESPDYYYYFDLKRTQQGGCFILKA